jgi:hypothetical protein
MSPTAVPTRITIDFRDSVHPSRTWILGLDAQSAGSAGRRVELLAFEGPGAPTLGSPVASPPPAVTSAHPTAIVAECGCPEFCERDHANE